MQKKIRHIHHRYLDAESKDAELIRFASILDKNMPPLGNQCGLGFVDPEIIPLCHWLNERTSLCTLQSCAGHPASKKEWQTNGCLWIWTDAISSKWFYKRGFELIREPHIEIARTCYSKTGQEYIEIIFQGNNYGKDTLDRSIASIKNFFKAHSI